MKRHSDATPTPPDPARYIDRGRLIDLVACYQSRVPNPDGFADCVRQTVRDVASWGGGKVQVGEEFNVPAPLEGSSPGRLPAIAAGVSAALDERTMDGVDVEVGVNNSGLADPVFWTRFADAIGPAALSQLNYIGLDMFPDVFHPVPEEKLVASQLLMEKLRTAKRDIGVSEHVPMHITETGWPTGGDRDEDKQARVLRPSRKPSSAPARSASTSSSGSGTGGPPATTTGPSDSGSCMTIRHPNRPTKSSVDSSRLNSP